ncbi:hypothetical protein [Streptomyces sp. AS02]|nr:hypothetical protein [Streptomyces sp. AS02]
MTPRACAAAVIINFGLGFVIGTAWIMRSIIRRHDFTSPEALPG